jgi:thioredoxin-like negative regulator of GroEL
MRELLSVLARAAWATPQGAMTATRLSEAAVRSGYAARARDILSKVSTDLEAAAAQAGLGAEYQTIWGTAGRPPKRKKR